MPLILGPTLQSVGIDPVAGQVIRHACIHAYVKERNRYGQLVAPPSGVVVGRG